MLKQPIQIFVHKLAYEQKPASAAFSKNGFSPFLAFGFFKNFLLKAEGASF